MLERLQAEDIASRNALLALLLDNFVASEHCNPLYLARLPRPAGVIKDPVVPVSLCLVAGKLDGLRQVADKVCGGRVSKLLQAALHLYYPPVNKNA